MSVPSNVSVTAAGCICLFPFRSLCPSEPLESPRDVGVAEEAPLNQDCGVVSHDSFISVGVGVAVFGSDFGDVASHSCRK